MENLPDALLLCGAALVIHIGLLPDLIWYFRELPDGKLMRLFRWLGGAGGPREIPGIAPDGKLMRVYRWLSGTRLEVPRTGPDAWAGIVLGVAFQAIATLCSVAVVFLGRGGLASAVGILEVAIAIAWLRYLLTGGPIPTPRRDIDAR